MLNKRNTFFFSGQMISMILFPVFFFLPVAAFPSGNNYPPGSRAAAMGNASVATSDLWSVHHNQAGLAGLTAFQAGFHYENRYFVPELGLQALALALPASPGTIGLSYSYFGFSHYNESKLGLAFGRRLGEKIAAGIRINYLYTSIAGDHVNRGAITAEGGIIAQPVKGFFIAAHIYNPARINKHVNHGEPQPVIFRAGIAGLAGERLLVAVEAEKESDFKTVLRAGLEMEFAGEFYMRAGLSSGYIQSSFGLGYAFGKLIADMAFTSHQILGFSPHITVNYILR